RGTPGDAIERLNKAANAALSDPALRARCIALGAVPEPMTPPQFGTLMASAATKWAKVISFANIKVD
ncbi:MAG: tripartite tricarboxylate transporter substrate binding protein, partial [Xanthobacteraceae bacterium]